MDSRVPITEVRTDHVHASCWDVKTCDLRALLREIVVYFFIVPENFNLEFCGRSSPMVSGGMYFFSFKVWKRGSFETSFIVTAYEGGFGNDEAEPVVQGVVFVNC